jgi:hypothetical protein
MMTPSQLADEMNRRGYRVSVRQLRDWRGKRLLPPLTTRGMGRGLGRQSYWEDHGILNRAITVYELLAKRERFPDAHYLRLWFAGYPADYDVIREAWLASLRCTERAWLHGASDLDGIEDALAPISAQIGRKISLDTGLPYEETQALVLEALNAVFSPAADFDIAECTELVDTANAWLSQPSAPHAGSSPITGEMLRTALAFLRANISLESMNRVISAATDAELENAHRRWRALHQVIELLASTTFHGEISAEVSRTGRQLSAMLSCPGMFALLCLGRNGMGQLVDARLNEAEQQIRIKFFPSSGDQSGRGLHVGLSVQRTQVD